MLPVREEEDRSTTREPHGPDYLQTNCGTSWNGNSWSRSAPAVSNEHSGNWRKQTRSDESRDGSTDTRGTTGMHCQSRRKHWRSTDPEPSHPGSGRNDRTRGSTTKRQGRRFRFYPLLPLILRS